MRERRPWLLAAPVLALAAAFGCGGGGGDGDAGDGADPNDADAGRDTAADPDGEGGEDPPIRDGEDGREGAEDPVADPASEEGPAVPSVVTLDPDDGHWFSSGGRLLYLAGYYPSIAALTADQTDYVSFYRNLIDRQEQGGINYFRQAFTMGQPFGGGMIPYERTGPGEAADGGPRVDLTRFDQVYFDYWRAVVEYAASKGVVVQVTILDTWHNKDWVVEDGGPQHVWGMQYDFYNGSNNVNGIDTADVDQWTDPSHPVFNHQQSLIARVVETLGDLPNIVWEVSNENYYNAGWEIQLADFITARESASGFDVHLVMPRDLPNHDSAGGKGNDPPTVHAEIVANFPLGQPLVADNDGGGGADPDGRRRKAWAALTGGGHIDYFHFELFQPAVLDSADAADGMRYVGYTRSFIDSLGVDLRGMAPDDSLVSSGWCLASPGERYVVYLPAGGPTTLTGLPATFEAWWFNPREGTSSAAAGGPEFSAPDGQDWVLFVHSSP